MADVIDLISSSPPCEPARHVEEGTLDGRNRLKEIFRFASGDDGDSDGSESLAFVSEQPAKKIRLDHTAHLSPQSTTAQSVGRNLDKFLQFSSEADSLPSARKIVGSSTLVDALDVLHHGSSFDGRVVNGEEPDDVFNFDGISSSAPIPERNRPSQSGVVVDLLSDDGNAVTDPIMSSSQPNELPRICLSQKTVNLLASVRAKSVNSGSKVTKASSASRFAHQSAMQKAGNLRGPGHVLDEIADSSQPGQIQIESDKSKTIDKQKNAASKAEEKAIKDAEKAAEKERKKQEKEIKMKEKQRAADIAEANKLKTNKKASASEMTIDIPKSLKGLAVANQVEEFMRELDVKWTYVDYGASTNTNIDTTTEDEPELTNTNIVTWKRKVTAEYDEDHEIWQPLSKPRISNEEHVLVYLKAEEFVRMTIVGKSSSITSATEVSEEVMKSNIDTHIKELRTRFPGCRLIYLIEGLTAWLKRSQTAKNRAYVAAVRAQPLEPDPTDTDPTAHQASATTTTTTASSKRRKKSTTATAIDFSTITESTTEDLLLHMQLQHQPLLIHHTTSTKTTAAQISTFTQHLSTRPYRLAAQHANLISASFCMTTGQIRTGSTAEDTWIQMLQEINRVTPSMAYGIMGAGYRNPTQLVRAFRQEDRLMLEDVRKSTNKDGGWSDRRLGPMVSKRIYKVFMGVDPLARDGIA